MSSVEKLGGDGSIVSRPDVGKFAGLGVGGADAKPTVPVDEEKAEARERAAWAGAISPSEERARLKITTADMETLGVRPGAFAPIVEPRPGK